MLCFALFTELGLKLCLYFSSVRIYGEFAPECAEVYYYYGDSLLSLASEEQSLFEGDAAGIRYASCGWRLVS